MRESFSSTAKAPSHDTLKLFVAISLCSMILAISLIDPWTSMVEATSNLIKEETESKGIHGREPSFSKDINVKSFDVTSRVSFREVSGFRSSLMSDSSYPVWFESIGGEYEDICYDIASSGDSVYVVGYTDKYEVGYADVLVARISKSDGSIEWMVVFGGEDEDYGFGAYLREEYLYIAGMTKSFGYGFHL